MAGCNLAVSGHTGVIRAEASVYELSSSGSNRQVRLVLQVWAADYSGARDAGYSVYCRQSGTNVSVPVYNGFTITGSPQTIFDEIFFVTVSAGSSVAEVELSFSASLISPSSGTRSVSGSISALYLTQEPDAPEVSPSEISLSADTVQMGADLLISITRDSAACRHRLTCWFSDREYLEIASDVAGSYVWTLPDLTDLCPDGLERDCRILCTTFLDGAYIGLTEAQLTIRVPEPAVPELEGGEIILGQECTVLCRRNSENFTQKLTLEFYGLTLEIGEGKADAFSWVPGYEPARQIPSLTRGTGTLTCTTFHGTAQVGVKTAAVRVVVPENQQTRPRFTGEGVTLTPVGSLPEAFAGVYLRGKTGLRAEFSARSDYSSIETYSLTVGSQKAEGNPAVLPLLVAEGDVKVIVRVTDARGFSSVITTAIQVLPYRNPRVVPGTGHSTVVCERAEENGELSTRGTYLAIRAGKSFSSVVLEGKEQNRCVLRWRWKRSGADSYCSWITLLPEDSQENECSLLVGNVVTSLQHSYLVQIEAADTLGESHILSFQIMTEAVSFVLYDGEDGAGFGKYPEEPHVVDIASHMTLRVRGSLVMEGASWQDLGLAEGITEAAVSCGHKQESGCHYLVWGGSHVYLAFDCSFDSSQGTVVLNRTPIPEASRPRRRACALCPVEDGIALVCADTDGYIRVLWVQHLIQTDTAVTWLDGYLDYWTG